jgi:5'(3')-deoxyribonucleotidase
MKYKDIKEGVGRITKQNQTVDVGPNEISIQAAKFGNKVDKDGRPANMKKKVKGSKTNVLFNLGMSESVDNLYESVLYYRQMKENLGEIAQATEIYVDMDGVLADFFGEWAKLMKVDHFSKIDKEHKIGDALQAIRDTDNFWLNLPLLPQAKQLLLVIKQIKGEYNICSSPLADDPNSEPHKREWIKKNLAFFPPKEVIITSNKPEYATQQDGTPNILIDDFGKNVNEWEAAGGTAFKYKDHKFERTANAIKQHMQEPVEESIIVEHPAVILALYAAGTTARELVKRYGLKAVRQALDKLKNQKKNIQKPANDHGGYVDNMMSAAKKTRTPAEIARAQQMNLPKELNRAKEWIRGASKEYKAGKLSKEDFTNVMRYLRVNFKKTTGKELPINDLLKLKESFDTQVDWEIDDEMTQGDGEAYKANIGNKEVGIQYYFEVIDAGGFPLSGVDITFEVNMTTKKTGTGDASTIFGAVVNHIKQFINQHDEVKAIEFSASKEQGFSRTRLYSAMVDKLSQGTDWINAKTISKADNSVENADVFKLIRRSAVNDKMVGIDENVNLQKEALNEQLTRGDKDTITSLYKQYKDEIQKDLQPLAARAYDAAINDKPLSSSDRRRVKDVYDQVMPQLPSLVKLTYSDMINRGVDQLLNPAASQNTDTQKAKPYDMPIQRDIADLIMQAYPEIKDIWVTSDQYDIVGTKLKNGPEVLKLQRQMKKDGYPITVDGKVGNKLKKLFKHWLANVIHYITNDYFKESVTENFAESLDKLIVKADNGKVFDISNLPGTLQEKIDSFKDSIKKVYSKSKASVPSFKFYLNNKLIGSSRSIGNVYKKVPGEDELDAIAKRMSQGQESIEENFADGKVKGKSKPGRVKRSGASCNGSVTELRAKAKKASGERAKMYHWCANMKGGRG